MIQVFRIPNGKGKLKWQMFFRFLTQLHQQFFRLCFKSKIMKKLFLLLFALFLFAFVIAQPEKGYVYLKNGSVIKGKYQYSADLEKVKVESAGNIWVFKAGEIDSIKSFRSERSNFLEPEQNSPFFYHVEIGVLAGNSGNSQSAPFSSSLAMNYKVFPLFSAGAGLGVEFLKETYLPLLANLEFKFRNYRSSPYLFLKAGYQLPLGESQQVYYDIYPMWSSYWPYPDYQNKPLDTKGGILLNTGLGYERMFSQGFGMSFAFGYQFHRLHYTGENEYALNIDYNRLTIKLGIIFY